MRISSNNVRQGVQKMKTIIKGLLVLFGLTSSMVSADALREADDTYIGFQMTASLDSISRGLFSGDHQYNYLFVQQRNGIKDGIVLTQDNYGNRTLNYLRPSHNFDIGQSRVVEYAVPIMQLEAQDSPSTEGSSSGTSSTNVSTVIVVVGLAALVAIPLMVKRDLEKDWEPAD
jgi:hypothetical protein